MKARDLLAAITSQEPISGAALAHQFGVSRTAIWKQIESLRQLGAPIEAASGIGYRLAAPMDLLSVDGIRSALAKALQQHLHLDVQWSIDSTNDALLKRPASEVNWHVCLAEHQRRGRGRRGRAWVSPLGSNVYLSLSVSFEQGLAALGGLPLVVGISVVNALHELRADSVMLKWPNDLVQMTVDSRHHVLGKLGGILIEADGDVQGPSRAVIGLGLNVRMPIERAVDIDQAWSDLSKACAVLPSRNQIAAVVLNHLVNDLSRFAREGFEPFRKSFDTVDALRGKRVRVHEGQGGFDGIADGIDAQGALLVQTLQGVRKCQSGEVSVRVGA